MAGTALTLAVAGLCLLAGVATVSLVRALRRRRGATLRAKLVGLFIGLAGAEASSLPALAMAGWGGDAFGLAPSGLEAWLLAALYVALTLYVLWRLFPWREVNAMAADPEISLLDALARLRAADDQPENKH